MTLADSIAPAFLVMPVAGLALLVLAAHVVSLAKSDMPASRRRIRVSNGLLMMFAVPLAAYAFSIVSVDRPRAFALAWMLVAGLLVLIVALAVVDLLNTFRLHRAERRHIRRELSHTLRNEVAALRQQRDARPAAPGAP